MDSWANRAVRSAAAPYAERSGLARGVGASGESLASAMHDADGDSDGSRRGCAGLDEEVCRWRGHHKHSGPLGCRIDAQAAGVWRATLESNYHLLLVAARKKARVHEPVMLARAWEDQQRGAPHCHMVTAVTAAGERFVDALMELAPRYGFGEIRDRGYASQGAYAHAAYLGNYITKYDERVELDRRAMMFEAQFLPGQSIWVSTILTRRSGATMEVARLVRSSGHSQRATASVPLARVTVSSRRGRSTGGGSASAAAKDDHDHRCRVRSSHGTTARCAVGHILVAWRDVGGPRYRPVGRVSASMGKALVSARLGRSRERGRGVVTRIDSHSPVTLNRLDLTNFLSYRKAHVQFGSLTALVGPRRERQVERGRGFEATSGHSGVWAPNGAAPSGWLRSA